MFDVLRTIFDYTYACSKDLLINIPADNYQGILGPSMSPGSNICDYIKGALQWDPRWGFNIFHVLHAQQGGVHVSCANIFFPCRIFLYNWGFLVWERVCEELHGGFLEH